MKKNLVIGTLLIGTILMAVAPAMAARIVIGGRDGIRLELGNRPERPGFQEVEVRDVSERGEWVRLNLDRAVYVSSVSVRGIGGDVYVSEARVYPVNGPSYNVRARGSEVRLSGRERVSAVDVWVESQPDRRDRRDRWDRRDRHDRRGQWERTHALITVDSASGMPYVRVSRF